MPSKRQRARRTAAVAAGEITDAQREKDELKDVMFTSNDSEERSKSGARCRPDVMEERDANGEHVIGEDAGMWMPKLYNHTMQSDTIEFNQHMHRDTAGIKHLIGKLGKSIKQGPRE